MALEECLDERDVVAMASKSCRDMPPYRISEQVEISDEIENFVARELVRKSKRRVDHVVFSDEDKVVEPASGAETKLVQHRDVAQESERASWRYFVSIRLEPDQFEVEPLVANRRGIGQVVRYPKSWVRLDANRPRTLAKFDRFLELELPGWRILVFESNLFESPAELHGRAIEYGDLVVDFEKKIRHSGRTQGGKKVLHGPDDGPVVA